jgi:hypothetical protein
MMKRMYGNKWTTKPRIPFALTHQWIPVAPEYMPRGPTLPRMTDAEEDAYIKTWKAERPTFHTLIKRNFMTEDELEYSVPLEMSVPQLEDLVLGRSKMSPYEKGYDLNIDERYLNYLWETIDLHLADLNLLDEFEPDDPQTGRSIAKPIKFPINQISAQILYLKDCFENFSKIFMQWRENMVINGMKYLHQEMKKMDKRILELHK